MREERRGEIGVAKERRRGARRGRRRLEEKRGTESGEGGRGRAKEREEVKGRQAEEKEECRKRNERGRGNVRREGRKVGPDEKKAEGGDEDSEDEEKIRPLLEDLSEGGGE